MAFKSAAKSSGVPAFALFKRPSELPFDQQDRVLRLESTQADRRSLREHPFARCDHDATARCRQQELLGGVALEVDRVEGDKAIHLRQVAAQLRIRRLVGRVALVPRLEHELQDVVERAGRVQVHPVFSERRPVGVQRAQERVGLAYTAGADNIARGARADRINDRPHLAVAIEAVGEGRRHGSNRSLSTAFYRCPRTRKLLEQRALLCADDQIHIVVVAGDDQAADDVAGNADAAFPDSSGPQSHD